MFALHLSQRSRQYGRAIRTKAEPSVRERLQAKLSARNWCSSALKLDEDAKKARQSGLDMLQQVRFVWVQAIPTIDQLPFR